MKCLINIILIIFCYTSCSLLKKQCDYTLLHFEDKDNDTSEISYRIPFYDVDTTVYIIHGYVIDRTTLAPIAKAAIYITKGTDEFAVLTTDTAGRFGINSSYLMNSSWAMKISHPDYKSLTIVTLRQFRFGEYWINFKIKKKV